MKNTYTKTIAILAVLAVLLGSFVSTQSVFAAADNGRRGPVNAPRGLGMQVSQTGMAGLNTAPLSDAEAEGLQNAILEEMGAVNTYQEVIAKLGSGTVFDRIARSEQMHVNALVRVAERHGVSIPENNGETAGFVYTTLAEACASGAEFEQIDADLYTELMAETENLALTRVYTNLQRASLENHLPAFEACK